VALREIDQEANEDAGYFSNFPTKQLRITVSLASAQGSMPCRVRYHLAGHRRQSFRSNANASVKRFPDEKIEGVKGSAIGSRSDKSGFVIQKQHRRAKYSLTVKTNAGNLIV
jgi:hypothetical protein